MGTNEVNLSLCLALLLSLSLSPPTPPRSLYPFLSLTHTMLQATYCWVQIKWNSLSLSLSLTHTLHYRQLTVGLESSEKGNRFPSLPASFSLPLALSCSRQRARARARALSLSLSFSLSFSHSHSLSSCLTYAISQVAYCWAQI